MATKKKRQLTINGTFRRQAAIQLTENDGECQQLEQEIEELKQQLAQKQAELLEIKSESLKAIHQARPLKLKTSKEPQLAAYEAQKSELEQRCWRQKLVMGLEVVEYEKEFFTIVYNPQHDSPHPIEYGLHIEIENGVPGLQKYSLPIGFNLNAVLGPYDSIGHSQTLCAVWTALVAFHTRRQHFQLLNRLRLIKVETFSLLDTSYVEVKLKVFRLDRPKPVVDLALKLDYSVMDVLPYKMNLRADVSQKERRSLELQCSVFRKKPLHEAFQLCFMNKQALWQYTADVQEKKAETQPEKPAAQKRLPQRPLPPDSDYSWDPEDSN